MKKITLIAASAMVAVAAQAQYSVDPSTAVAVKNFAGKTVVDYITLSDAAVADMQNAGATVNYVGSDENAGRNLWYWKSGEELTFNPGDESYPRVDMEEGGYISVVVTNQGWSGAGIAVDAPGVDLSHITDATHFHLAYMTPSGNGPASIAVILLDKSEKQSMPAKFAIGDPFNDNGAIFPSVAPKINDDWQGLDITIGDLKKIYPTFSPANLAAWEGNMFAWLGGGVQGQTIAFDAVYFYTPGTNGVESVEAEAEFIVTGNTVNVAGTNGIELYNMAGQLVKSTNGTTLGLDSLQNGVYVAKAGNKVQKIVVR